jgi:hypothetical protein
MGIMSVSDISIIDQRPYLVFYDFVRRSAEDRDDPGMTLGVLSIIIIVSLLLVMGLLWQLRQVMLRLVSNQESQVQKPDSMQRISRQVHEIHQSMGGVINGLKAVGSQMNYLNQLAGHALQSSQQEHDVQGGPQQTPPILIQIRGNNNPDQQQGPQVLNPEDLSPEMQERYRIFQAVYQAILSEPDFPSRERPDLN